MSKVVYLMGAGASYGTRAKNVWAITSGIPVVNEIPGELGRWARDVALFDWSDHASYRPQDSSFEVDLIEAQKRLSTDLTWLAEESAKHATIDTFAKKLYLTKDFTNYNRLKRALSSFFMIEQVEHKSDMRYDAFLANILTEGCQIPDDITILTWNYDSQFEIALRTYLPHLANLQISPICLSSYDSFELKVRYKIFKINGSATFSDEKPISRFCTADEQKFSEKSIRREVLWYYGNGNLQSNLSFAWDNSVTDYFYYTIAKEVKDAMTLVVIGYTFPYFNRATDRKLFSMMGNLRNIIIQDPNADAIVQNVQSVFPDYNTMKGISFQLEKHVDSFIIPREL